MTYQEILNKFITKMIDYGFEYNTAKQDAIDILIHILRITKAELITKTKEQISITNEDIFQNAIEQRINHKPLQYITNNAIFFGYDFFVNENCLIPRVDSEVLVEQALRYVDEQKIRNINIVDACCGSGCLGLSLVKKLLEKNIYSYKLKLIDKSSVAIQIAKINAQRLNIKPQFIIADVLSYGFGEDEYDIILCNPPYIETDTIKLLPKEVKNYEPIMALDGGTDGLKFYNILSKKLLSSLKEDGLAVFEIGYNQGYTVKEIFENELFKVNIIKDYGGNDRCAIIHR